MKIETVSIQNFRAIQKQSFSAKELSILIGNNATGKTSVLEAIHFALSPYFINDRIKHTDFYNGCEDPILIDIEFDNSFEVEIPDGYTTQKILCKKIHLEIKKRDRATPGKAFSSGFVVSHFTVPVIEKIDQKGWEIKRNSGTPFRFSEHHLEFSSMKSDQVPKSFYFNKNRNQQIKKGYNSSIGSVFDDFNWRFLKGLRKEDENNSAEEFINKKNSIESEILDKIDDAALKKSIKTLNDKLKLFKLDESKISFIDGSAPFDSAFLSMPIGSLDLVVSALGSGIEMIISLLFLETLASLSKENIIIIIDEPELHLHPYFQECFIQYLKSISLSKQIFLSTHSPYFFKNCQANDKIELLITTIKNNSCSIDNSHLQLKSFPWSPSWGEINYFAYDLPTIEFHNELYGYLQEKNKAYMLKDFEIFLESKKIPKPKNWIKVQDGKPLAPEPVSLMTFIRNCIHHPENKNNIEFTPEELKESIDSMLTLLI